MSRRARGGEARLNDARREPAQAVRILPVELRVGDRLSDETGEWAVIAPPYSTAGVQRIDQPASWEIRSWDAFKHVSVKRATAEEGKR